VPSVRHLRSILYALVLAPAVWVLCGAGFARDLTGRSSWAGLLLVLAGAAYAVLLLGPISPIGPLIAGLVFLALGTWGMTAPDSYASIWPSGAVRDDFDLSRPGYALAVLLAVPLACTALSARRWAGREPMVGAPGDSLGGALGGDARGAAAAPGTPVAAESTAVLTAPASASTPPARPAVPTVPGSPSADGAPTEVLPVAASDEPTLVTGRTDDTTVVVTARDEPTVVVTDGDEPTVVTASDAGDEPTVFVVNSDGETTAPGRAENLEDDEPTVVAPSDENTEVVLTGAEKADAEKADTGEADAEEAEAAPEEAESTEDEAEPTVEVEEPAAESEEPAAEPEELEEPAAEAEESADETEELPAAAEQPAAEEAEEAEEVEAEAIPDEPQDDPGDRTQVIPLRPAATSTEKTHDLRDMVRRPGNTPGEETQVIFWRPPSEADVRRAAEAQAARDREAQEQSRQAFRDLAAQERARKAFAEQAARQARERGEETQVIKLPGADEPAADRTQVLSAAQPAAAEPPTSIVGEERPDPGVDPTTRLVRPSDDTTADPADQRVGSVLDLERPADEIADDPTRRLSIPKQRADDGDRRGATPR